MAAHRGRKGSDASELTISDQLREAIEECGESQLSLAKRAGISSQQLSRFLNQDKSKRRDLTLATVDKLAKALCLRLETP